MKNNRYRRLRAQEMAHRDWLAGAPKNPFIPETLEHRIYNKHYQYLGFMDADFEHMLNVYGGQELYTKRSPNSVHVRPALQGFQ